MDSDPNRSASATSRRSRRPRRLARLAVASAVVALAALAVFHRPIFLGNVGEVAPGRVYRCSQPKGNLDALLASLRPGSILNLRGGSYADDWYLAEVRASDRLGIDFYDFPMEATRRPSRSELLTLIDVIDRCRYPLLIHCKSGADRTGLASALALMLLEGRPPDRAREQFSISYGHVPIGGPERLHEPLIEYEQWLSAEGRSHSPALFRGWVERHYRDEGPPETGTSPSSPLEPGSRMGPPSEWLAKWGRASRG
ncbi:tyrosine-protein phosphatase [Tautonia plasticadhaerens]|uniref:tyrosine-protein phosphatase n=1 Tax=Tautonia plasticadhaerens TaxID=2527974 RepID=UPI0011A1E205|nr:tyrosine-protein phosphatase [Tautonia plasticadhaerens]